MASDPLVSIVTPSFNQGDFIEDTIRSVLAQDYSPIEHIIVDGGSTDQTIQILSRYDERVRWASEPDQGPADGCNKGFRYINGEILGYLNSDDVLLPHAVEILVQVFIAHPTVDVVYGDAFIIDEKNRVSQRIFSAPFFNPHLYVLGGFAIAQQATFWRRDAFEAVGGFNPKNKTCWDAELWVDMSLKGAKFKHINCFLAGFRHHSYSISISGRLASEYRRDSERLFEKVYKRSPTILDRYFLSVMSRAFGRLMPPQKLFPRLGVAGMKIDVE